MLNLIRTIRAICPLSYELRDALEEDVKERVCRKNEVLLKSGQICGNIYFVMEGLLWQFYDREKVPPGDPLEKDKYWKDPVTTSGFAKAGCFSTSLESFFSQQYGEENIVALEPTHVAYFSFNSYQHYSIRFPEFNNVCRILLERCNRQREERLRMVTSASAKARLDWFLENHEDLVQRVAQRRIATYLGVSESIISKVK